jgi:hypothetical protein
MQGCLIDRYGTGGRAAYGFAGCAVAITLCGLAAYLAKQPMLFPSLGPSALLFFGRFPRPRSGAASGPHRPGGPPWHKTPSS